MTAFSSVSVLIVATHDVIYWPVSEESYVFCLLFWYCCDYGSVFLRQYVLFYDNADIRSKTKHRGFNKPEQWTTLGWENLLLLLHNRTHSNVTLQKMTFDEEKSWVTGMSATKMDLKLTSACLERLLWDLRRIFCRQLLHSCWSWCRILSLPHKCLFVGVKRGWEFTVRVECGPRWGSDSTAWQKLCAVGAD